MDGHVNLYVRDANGSEVLMKEVEPGDSIHSLLSILDIITGMSVCLLLSSTTGDSMTVRSSSRSPGAV